MSRDKSKLTKAAQTAQTRRAILDHARQLFASQGYAATGTEEIIAGLGITRGALYHQFGNKQGVFQAVIEEAFLEIAQYIATQAQMVDAPWAQLVQGCHAFLEVAQREDIRRLVFVEAPAVLDAQTLMRFERQYGGGLLFESIQAVIATGELVVPNAEGFAVMVNGALDYLADWAAHTESETQLETAKTLAEQLLMHYRKP